MHNYYKRSGQVLNTWHCQLLHKTVRQYGCYMWNTFYMYMYNYVQQMEQVEFGQVAGRDIAKPPSTYLRIYTVVHV